MPERQPQSQPRDERRPAAPRGLARRLFGIALTLAAAWYLATVLRADAPRILAALVDTPVWRLVAASLAATIMGLLNAIYHRDLLRRISGREDTAGVVIVAYSQAQIIRYLPGKIWGIVHQANALSPNYRAHEVVLANALQGLMTNLFALGVIASLIGCSIFRHPWPLVGLPIVITASELLHRRPVLETRLLQLISRLRREQELAEAPLKIQGVRWRGTLILGTEWIAFLGAWYLASGHTLDPAQAIVLATWYSAASILSILAIAVPAGIVVREAIFVSLGQISAFPQSALVALAAVLRVILTAGELLCVPLAAAYRFLIRDVH